MVFLHGCRHSPKPLLRRGRNAGAAAGAPTLLRRRRNAGEAAGAPTLLRRGRNAGAPTLLRRQRLVRLVRLRPRWLDASGVYGFAPRLPPLS